MTEKLRAWWHAFRDEHVPNWMLGSLEPDFIIGDVDRPYLLRWFLLPRGKWLPNLYLHKIVRDDDDRALHDHPRFNVSLVLRGSYREIQPDPWHVNGCRWLRETYGIGPNHPRYSMACTGEDLPMRKIELVRRPWDLVARPADLPHRLEVIDGPVWTLWFHVGPSREWGFHCVHGWVHWREFTAPGAPGQVGRGCGEP